MPFGVLPVMLGRCLAVVPRSPLLIILLSALCAMAPVACNGAVCLTMCVLGAGCPPLNSALHAGSARTTGVSAVGGWAALACDMLLALRRCSGSAPIAGGSGFELSLLLHLFVALLWPRLTLTYICAVLRPRAA